MSEATNHPRWRLLRDLLIFQAKLLVDGLRDLVMSPISLFAALAGLLTQRNDPERYFRKVIRIGARSERWINLFERPEDPRAQSLDELFDRLEQRVVEQYERGGLTAHAKHAIDKSLDAVHQGIDAMAARRAAAEDRKDSDPGAGPAP